MANKARGSSIRFAPVEALLLASKFSLRRHFWLCTIVELDYLIRYMQRSNALYILTAAAVLFSLLWGIFLLARTVLPTADVTAQQAADRPIIQVNEFSPGEVEIIALNSHRVVVWRRSDADKKLAAGQNAPEDWRYQNSSVLGKPEPIFADDTNLTLNDEWFFASAEFSNPYQYLLPRAGDFDGFFEGRFANHFDLAGRLRKGGGGKNLTVIEAEYVNDGKSIQLFLNGKP